MTAAEHRISLALVMREAVTAERAFPELKTELSKVGIEISSVGSITVSGAIPLKRFVHLFGVKPKYIEARPPNEKDMGASGGFLWEEELTIPPPLRQFVRHISVVPPPVRLND